MIFVATIIILCVWAFWTLSAAYLLLLLLAAALGKRPNRPAALRLRRFCLLIPAHNEELLLGPVLQKLSLLDYPPDCWSAVVVADNCTDSTALVARRHGADVLERTDEVNRGKGYALQWAVERLLTDSREFDAFVVLDADSVLSLGFLDAMNRALAEGHLVIQAYYGVLNTDESWRTRLMAVALALAHYVKPLGRRSLGLSDGLKGNGMCFAREALERVPWSGESITEDIEQTLRLVEAGIKIEFAPDAVVSAQMPITGNQAASQRRRWEGGRYALLKKALTVLIRAIARGRWRLADRAIELIVPPFVELLAVPAVFAAGCALWMNAAHTQREPHLLLWMWLGTLCAGLVYLVGGLFIARVPLSTAKCLLYGPVYMIWKLALYAGMAVRKGAGGWVRTERRTL